MQDSWRATPNLTLNLGLRFEQQRPFQNRDGTYSGVTYGSLWSIACVGRLFQPGATGRVKPPFDKYNSDYYKIPNMWNPSAGFAWRLPGSGGPLGFPKGRESGKMVLRAGYGIASVRNGSYTFQSLLGSNQGLNYDASLNLTDFSLANGPSSTSFGRTTSYFNDFSGSADSGSRIIEFRLRVSF